MTLGRVVDDYTSALGTEKQAALAVVMRRWRRMTPDLDASWQTIKPSIIAATVGAQLEIGGIAADYAAASVAEVYRGGRIADYEPALDAWAGLAGDGRTVAGLVDGAVVTAKDAIKVGKPLPEALASGGAWLSKAVATAMADTHRGVEQVGFVGRRVRQYARQLTGSTNCGRCIILAGRLYYAQTAFLRHPQCDCTHVPAADAQGGAALNPHEYLDGLSDEQLARALGSKANAQAWRDGADVNQLINAYRSKGGVQTAQNGWRFTTEGTARRGAGRQAMTAAGMKGARLMPSTIYEIAKDRDEALRMLRAFGWIL